MLYPICLDSFDHEGEDQANSDEINKGSVDKENIVGICTRKCVDFFSSTKVTESPKIREFSNFFPH